MQRSSPLPIPLCLAERFFLNYCFDATGARQSPRIPFIFYTPSMWANLAGRVAMESYAPNAERSIPWLEVTGRIEALSSRDTEDPGLGRSRLIVFRTASGIGLSLRMLYDRHEGDTGFIPRCEVRVGDGAVQAFCLDDAEGDAVGVSRAIMGNGLAGVGFSRFGVAYESSGIEGAMMAEQSVDRPEVWRFTTRECQDFHFNTRTRNFCVSRGDSLDFDSAGRTLGEYSPWFDEQASDGVFGAHR